MTYLIIGGTGSLGEALIEHLQRDNLPHLVKVFSRDELKQSVLKKKYPGIEMIIGDVRDKESLKRAMLGVSKVFHFAALKHVDIVESNIEEAVSTNIIGLFNSAEAAIDQKVKQFYFTSTDKAVLPINVYGMTKGIGERYLLDKNRKQNVTEFKVFRWGNIIGSRGSVIPHFIRSITERGVVDITDEKMTRFWLPIDEAIHFMFTKCSFQRKDSIGVRIPSMKSAKVMDVAKACAKFVTKVPRVSFNVVGIRPGEKIHEMLTDNISSEHVNLTKKEIEEMVKNYAKS